jgi:hypothetical protein
MDMAFVYYQKPKKIADQIRDLVIKKYGKTPTYDQIILQHLKASSTELVDEIGKSTITWRDEEKRIKHNIDAIIVAVRFFPPEQ